MGLRDKLIGMNEDRLSLVFISFIGVSLMKLLNSTNYKFEVDI